jgi:hypothetical protein
MISMGKPWSFHCGAKGNLGLTLRFHDLAATMLQEERTSMLQENSSYALTQGKKILEAYFVRFSWSMLQKSVMLLFSFTSV